MPLKLIPNTNLIAPNFKVLIHDEDSFKKFEADIYKNCYYLHKNNEYVAAISLCQPKTVVRTTIIIVYIALFHLKLNFFIPLL